jgi:aryl-alcohol dehydrogenase-like predicted oxidoreductase
MTRLGNTDLDVFPLCLGGNVFGWTADEETSHAILDAYAEAGGNFVDTANSYMRPHPGISETIIGSWLAARGNRDRMVIATKVGGSYPGLDDLRPETIARGARESLERLQTDRIDLLYAHKRDTGTPLEDSLRAFDRLVREGLVRHVGFSNHAPEQVAEIVAICEREGLTRATVLQDHYNLVERDAERELLPLCQEHGLAMAPYYGLARGFLTGKYRPGGEEVTSRRAEAARAYLEDDRAVAVLEALDEVADAHAVPPAAVALAWLRTRPAVATPIASARTPEQLAQLLPMAGLELGADELERLTAAGHAPSERSEAVTSAKREAG